MNELDLKKRKDEVEKSSLKFVTHRLNRINENFSFAILWIIYILQFVSLTFKFYRSWRIPYIFVNVSRFFSFFFFDLTILLSPLSINSTFLVFYTVQCFIIGLINLWLAIVHQHALKLKPYSFSHKIIPLILEISTVSHFYQFFSLLSHFSFQNITLFNVIVLFLQICLLFVSIFHLFRGFLYSVRGPIFSIEVDHEAYLISVELGFACFLDQTYGSRGVAWFQHYKFKNHNFRIFLIAIRIFSIGTCFCSSYFSSFPDYIGPLIIFLMNVLVFCYLLVSRPYRSNDLMTISCVSLFGMSLMYFFFIQCAVGYSSLFLIAPIFFGLNIIIVITTMVGIVLVCIYVTIPYLSNTGTPVKQSLFERPDILFKIHDIASETKIIREQIDFSPEIVDLKRMKSNLDSLLALLHEVVIAQSPLLLSVRSFYFEQFSLYLYILNNNILNADPNILKPVRGIFGLFSQRKRKLLDKVLFIDHLVKDLSSVESYQSRNDIAEITTINQSVRGHETNIQQLNGVSENVESDDIMNEVIDQGKDFDFDINSNLGMFEEDEEDEIIREKNKLFGCIDYNISVFPRSVVPNIINQRIISSPFNVPFNPSMLSEAVGDAILISQLSFDKSLFDQLNKFNEEFEEVDSGMNSPLRHMSINGLEHCDDNQNDDDDQWMIEYVSANSESLDSDSDSDGDSVVGSSSLVSSLDRKNSSNRPSFIPSLKLNDIDSEDDE
eukprot:TRINITY_DN2899_c0_g1_i1.p1 TRINITY_DN2899_c0_g1~~TRINITY_DN2899_c0_g1_i1.p1  ORF type:complete len:721 (+),score=178.84 TRINITY_DN2899_c0_g1_i1:83-2245(+)